MSPILKRYLTSYLLWAKARAAGESTDGMPPYSPYVGLCCNIIDYVQYTGDHDIIQENVPDWWREGAEPGGDSVEVVVDTINEEMGHVFIDDNLNCTFPFGYLEYEDGVALGNQHTQPRRLEWLESKVGV